MGRRKWIDKKTAVHFTLVHRPQNDPRINDEDAPAMVLNPTELLNNRGRSGESVTSETAKSKRLGELASQLGSEAENIRANEGEAANYGVYFDDSQYDYMQHLRDLGTGAGNAVFVEAPSVAAEAKQRQKQQQKQSLSEALKEMDLRDRSEQLLDEDILPAKNLQRVSYQNQQDVPDAIAGFQPDMDPRLREVLEALEDDAYVDDEDDDIFQALAKDGQEIDRYEFEETYDGEEGDYYDDGWESDATEKPASTEKKVDATTASPADADDDDKAPNLVDVSAAPVADDAWLQGYQQFKNDQAAAKASGVRKSIVPAMSEIESEIRTTTTNGGRRKKRKGALTTPSTYSMTSSSLVRTEQQQLLDARFEKIDKEYSQVYMRDEDEDDEGADMHSVSQLSSASTVQGPLRRDFYNIMDEFLANHHVVGKRRIRKGRPQTGLEQLDEIRQGLGPARLRTGNK